MINMRNDLDSCWNCKSSDRNLFFCNICKKIQKPVDLDPFKLFSLPYTFNINNEKLEEEFLGLQMKLHPDKFVNANDNEKLFSSIHSANLNESYTTLIDPILRAGALLKVFINYDLKEKTIQDKSILIEIMELEEEKEMIREEKASDIFFKKILALIDNEFRNIANKFQENNYSEAAKIHTKLTYLNKIKHEFKKGSELRL